jgi:hypothetical protein
MAIGTADRAAMRRGDRSSKSAATDFDLRAFARYASSGDVAA